MPEVAGLTWWGWALLIIGLLAVIMVISALFLPDFHVAELVAGVDPDSESPEFIDVLVGALGVPVLRGGTARVLQNGDAFFP